MDVPLERLTARLTSRAKAQTRPTLIDESRVDLALREAKRAALTAARVARWAVDPRSFAPPTLARHDPSRSVVLEERLAIARHDPHAHPVFEEGKRRNIALAATAFDGVELSHDRVFSFWRTLGPAIESRGFVAGMELAGGCVVPAIGGGLCLLSNGLFRLALRAGFVIVERHGHSLEAIAPEKGALVGADATVAFAHIDLRFRPQHGSFTLRAAVVSGALVLALESDEPLSCDVSLDNDRVELARDAHGRVRESIVSRSVRDRRTGRSEREIVAHDFKRVLDERELSRNCLTCGETDCDARAARLALVSAHQSDDERA